ncbi:MAG: VTC domain-containing protein [Bacteroidetes bacterium]|nr:VTC domain-containing protein [Bacteroidota bacterium]
MLVKEQIEAIYEKSNSQSHFNELLKLAGFSPYVRGTKSSGVKLEDGRNIRFKSLGFDTERLQELDRRVVKLQDFEKIRFKDYSKEKEHEVLKEVSKTEDSSKQESNQNSLDSKVKSKGEFKKRSLENDLP